MNKLFLALLLIAAGTGTGYVLLKNSSVYALHTSFQQAVAGEKIVGERMNGAIKPIFQVGVNCDQFVNPDVHEACLTFKQRSGQNPLQNISCDQLTNADEKAACLAAQSGTNPPPRFMPPPRNCDEIQNADEKATCLALRMVSTTPEGIITINCDQFTVAEKKQACLIAKQAAAKGMPRPPQMPFDCKNVSSGQQEKCEVEKRKIDPCHDVANGEKRAVCVREMLGLATSTKADLMLPCRASTGTEHALCEQITKDKIKSLVQFHLDDLIEKAQMASGTLLKESVRSSTIKTIEKAKLDLNKAKTLAARNAILNRVKATWKNITVRAKDKTVGNDTLNQAFSDMKKL